MACTMSSGSIHSFSRVLYSTSSKPIIRTKPLFSFLGRTSQVGGVASMSYHKELAAAKKAASIAACLCQKVQKALLQSDVQSKSDRSPVTVADYGSQALVSFVLGKELPSETFSLVAEEDSGDLRKEESGETLQRITKLVNDTLSRDGTYNISPLTEEDVLLSIDCGRSEGGSRGRRWVLDPIDGTKGCMLVLQKTLKKHLSSNHLKQHTPCMTCLAP